MFSLLGARVEEALLAVSEIHPLTSYHEFPACVLNLDRSVVSPLCYWQITTLFKNLQSTSPLIRCPTYLPSPTHCPEIKIQASKKNFQDFIRSGLCLPLSSPAGPNRQLLSSSNKCYFSFLCLCSSCFQNPEWPSLLNKSYNFFNTKQNIWTSTKTVFTTKPDVQWYYI